MELADADAALRGARATSCTAGSFRRAQRTDADEPRTTVLDGDLMPSIILPDPDGGIWDSIQIWMRCTMAPDLGYEQRGSEPNRCGLAADAGAEDGWPPTPRDRRAAGAGGITLQEPPAGTRRNRAGAPADPKADVGAPMDAAEVVRRAHAEADARPGAAGSDRDRLPVPTRFWITFGICVGPSWARASSDA